MHPLKLSCCASLLGVLLVGCAGAEGDAGRVEVYPVSGKITMGGKPVADATVTYAPKGEQPAATALTDAEGQYELTTYETGDGAAEGQYTVLVVKYAAAAEAAPEDAHEAFAEGGPAASHGGAGGGTASILPEAYASADTSPLTVSVPAKDESAYNFDLQ